MTGYSLDAEKTPDLRHAKSTRTTTTRSLKPKVTSNEQGNKKPEVSLISSSIRVKVYTFN